MTWYVLTMMWWWYDRIRFDDNVKDLIMRWYDNDMVRSDLMMIWKHDDDMIQVDDMLWYDMWYMIW